MRKVAWVGAGLLVVSACGGMNIRTDYDPQALPSFGSYRTYGWLPQPQGGDRRVNNDLVQRRIVRAVDTELQQRGYQLVTSGTRDFMVGWHAAIDGKMDVSTIDRYYGYRRGRWGGAGVVVSDTYVREYNQGTLVLDVVDAKSNELAWRGSAQAEVRENASPEEREARITKAVQEILKRFPPQ